MPKNIRSAAITTCCLVGLFLVVFISKKALTPPPVQKKIEVPFTPQAPTGDWSGIWENACEETTIYMISSFYQNDPIKREAAIQHIKEIIAVKNKTFKVSDDESLSEITALIKTLDLPWSTRFVADPTVDQLKTELAQNHPIIVPVFAPALRAAGFHGDGPDYHVMVLTGYDDLKKEFIVNDPGVTNGNGIHFPYDVFLNAIHDLNPKDYTAGKKAVLFTQSSDLSAF